MIGKADLAVARQEVDVVVVDLGGERRAPLLEVGHEVLERRRIEHGARQHVRAGLARLLEHGDRQRLAAALLLQLRQPERRRHPAPGPPPTIEDIDFEGSQRSQRATLSHLFSSAIIAGTTSNRSPDDAVVGDLEDRRLGVLVDRDDGARALHADEVLDRAGDAERDVELRRDGLARSCRSGDPSAASRRRRSGATRRARRPSPARAAAAICRCSCPLMPRPTATMRSACDRSTACFASLNGASGFWRIFAASIGDRRLVASARAAPPRFTASARNAPIWNVDDCGAGPTARRRRCSLPWNIGRT